MPATMVHSTGRQRRRSRLPDEHQAEGGAHRHGERERDAPGDRSSQRQVNASRLVTSTLTLPRLRSDDRVGERGDGERDAAGWTAGPASPRTPRRTARRGSTYHATARAVDGDRRERQHRDRERRRVQVQPVGARSERPASASGSYIEHGRREVARARRRAASRYASKSKPHTVRGHEARQVPQEQPEAKDREHDRDEQDQPFPSLGPVDGGGRVRARATVLRGGVGRAILRHRRR